jgi:hypothetical protein
MGKDREANIYKTYKELKILNKRRFKNIQIENR